MNYKYIPLYLVVSFMLGVAPAAQAQQELRKANKHFEKYEFSLALEQYQKASEKRMPDVVTTERIATSYRLTRRSAEAEKWYGQVVAMPGRDPMNVYHFAEALRSNGKYEPAKEQYMKWGEEMPEMEERAQMLMEACDKAVSWMKQLPVAEVEHLSGLSAKGFSDFSPMNYGQGIIFTSDRGTNAGGKAAGTYGWTGRPYLQLFTASRDSKGNWGAPTAMHEMINGEYHNATASATEDGQALYFTRTKLVQKRNTGNTDPTSWIANPNQATEYINRLEIYTAQKRGATWSDIKPFAYNNVEEYSVGHPALSPDGKIMYFASDMPGGIGETDIYYSLRQQDGSWGEPVNAGILINTTGRESFPYIDNAGKLHFASDGHSGMGGLDIFTTEGKHAAWTAVKNMGYPINSPKNDYGIMFDGEGETGLLSSNRDANDGTDDIYSFKMLQKPVVLAVTTLERKQNEQKKNVQVILPQVQLVISQKNLNDTSTVMTNRRGQYFMDGRKGNSYTFLGTKQGYLNQNTTVNVPTTAGDTVQVALLFDRDEKDKAIVLENIYYDLDKWDIRPDAATELDKLAAILEANPNVKIELSSHTDSRESLKYNQLLSERRAQAAVDYLITKGIASDRLTAKGYGKTRLVNDCIDGVQCPEELHQQNRRTEFRIK